MKRPFFTLLFRMVIGLSLFLLLGVSLGAIQAQEPGWSTPIMIAEDGNSTPLVADRAGNVHLFYLAWAGRKAESAWAGDTIFYRRLSQEEWSPTRDVFISPAANDTLGMPAVQATSDGLLHALWYGKGALWHSQAHASQADSARNWQTERLTSDQMPVPDLASDENDTLYAVYISELRKVMFMRKDFGGPWSTPVEVWGVSDPDRFAVGGVNIAVDDAGVIHLGWTENAEEVDWSRYSAWYMRSDDGGQTWSEPELLATPSYGLDTIIVGPDGQVWILVMRGIGFKDGRFYIYSTDHGKTLGEMRLLFPSLDGASGSTGGSGWALDSSGVVHLVNSAGRPGSGGNQEVYYTFWTGDRWADPTLIGTLAEVPRIAITGGNRLHVAYSRAGVWYTTKVIAAPEIALQPLPAPPSLPAEERKTTPTPEPTPTSLQDHTAFFDQQPAMPPTPAPWAPVVAGLVPALLIVTATVLIRLRRS